MALNAEEEAARIEAGYPPPVVRNAVRCTICQVSADRYANWYQCSLNPAHMGDLFVGIFSDCSPIPEPK